MAAIIYRGPSQLSKALSGSKSTNSPFVPYFVATHLILLPVVIVFGWHGYNLLMRRKYLEDGGGGKKGDVEEEFGFDCVTWGGHWLTHNMILSLSHIVMCNYIICMIKRKARKVYHQERPSYESQHRVETGVPVDRTRSGGSHHSNHSGRSQSSHHSSKSHSSHQSGRSQGSNIPPVDVNRSRSDHSNKSNTSHNSNRQPPQKNVDSSIEEGKYYNQGNYYDEEEYFAASNGYSKDGLRRVLCEDGVVALYMVIAVIWILYQVAGAIGLFAHLGGNGAEAQEEEDVFLCRKVEHWVMITLVVDWLYACLVIPYFIFLPLILNAQ